MLPRISTLLALALFASVGLTACGDNEADDVEIEENGEIDD